MLVGDQIFTGSRSHNKEFQIWYVEQEFHTSCNAYEALFKRTRCVTM
jgi:hypothetical protein